MPILVSWLPRESRLAAERIALCGLQVYRRPVRFRLKFGRTALLGEVKAVSSPCICNQKQGLGRIGLDFLPEPVYKNAKVFQLISIIRSPYSLKQFAMGDGLVGTRQEMREEGELPCRES